MVRVRLESLKMQEEPHVPGEKAGPRRAMSVDERAATTLSPSLSSDSTRSGRRKSAQSGQITVLPRAYEFVVNEGDDMTESRRKSLRQFVMKDYMHRRRTLATMHPNQDTGRLVGWRNVHLANNEETPANSEESGRDSPTNASEEVLSSQTSTPSSASTTAREKLPIQKHVAPMRIRPPNKIRQDEERFKPTNPPYPNFGGPWAAAKLLSLPSCKDQPTCETVSRDEWQNPQSRLGAGLVDPFDSFPVRMTLSDQALINHYLNTLPYIVYQILSGVDYNPHKLLFHQVLMHDAAAFQAILALASKHVVTGLSGTADTVQSLTHKTRTIQLVNKRLQDPATAVKDSTLYAIGALSVIEKWADNYEAERAHYRGMALLIKERGGMKEIRKSNRFLEAAIYWVEFSRAPGPNTIGSLPFSGQTPDDMPSSFDFLTAHIQFPIPYTPPRYSPMVETPGEIQDLLLACEQFLSFFHHLFALHRQYLASPSCFDPKRLHTIRRRVFYPGSILSKVLAENPWQYVRTVSGVRYSKDLCWMGSLLFINFALWDFSNQPERLERYLSWLENEVRLKGLDTNHSVETLLWVFWRDSANNGNDCIEEVDDSDVERKDTRHGCTSAFERKGVAIAKNVEERNWFVTRMLRVAKRLGPESWEKVRDTLLDFMLAPEQNEDDTTTRIKESPGPTRQLNRLPWEEDQLRREILATLYVSPPIFKDATMKINTADFGQPGEPQSRPPGHRVIILGTSFG